MFSFLLVVDGKSRRVRALCRGWSFLGPGPVCFEALAFVVPSDPVNVSIPALRSMM